MRIKPKYGVKTATVKVNLEDSIRVKKSVPGPDLLVTQFVGGQARLQKKIRCLGFRAVSPRAFKFLSRHSTGESLGGAD